MHNKELSKLEPFYDALLGKTRRRMQKSHQIKLPVIVIEINIAQASQKIDWRSLIKNFERKH